MPLFAGICSFFHSNPTEYQKLEEPSKSLPLSERIQNFALSILERVIPGSGWLLTLSAMFEEDQEMPVSFQYYKAGSDVNKLLEILDKNPSFTPSENQIKNLILILNDSDKKWILISKAIHRQKTLKWTFPDNLKDSDSLKIQLEGHFPQYFA